MPLVDVSTWGYGFLISILVQNAAAERMRVTV